MATDLEWALHNWRQSRKQALYHMYRAYFLGDQPLAFATEKFRTTFGHLFREFSENLCEPVVDALSDRLVIRGFKTNMAEQIIEEVQSNVPSTPGMPASAPRKKVTTKDEQGDRALEIWRRNRMDLASQEVHEEALALGDAYAIVWPNEDLEAEIWPQLATECCVQYDANNRDKIIRAAKIWFDEVDVRWFLNVYTEFGIWKYQQRNNRVELATEPDNFQMTDFVDNPYEKVPVFHFPNKAIKKRGFSELKNVVPLQNGLNKSVMDLMISMEFASFKQRYVIGLDLEIDETTGEPKDASARQYGVDRLLTFPDIETKVGQFDATDLSQFLRVQEKFWASVARVSGTPLHYFFITEGDFPSGEAMKAAEARFIKKITDRQIAFGNVWEDVMLFALRIDGVTPADLRIETLWKDASPRSESELADTAVKKKAVGVSRSQILKELGYDDETIMRMLEESDADSERQSMLKQGPDKSEGTELGKLGSSQPSGQRTRGTSGVRRGTGL